MLISVVRVPDAATAGLVLWALASGALFALGAQAFMHVLFSEEVSRTVPVIQSAPIFTALFAFFFLGEQLGPVEWLAIVAVVAERSGYPRAPRLGAGGPSLTVP